MSWYAAHSVCYWCFLDGNQDSYLIWESVHLVRASSLDEARSTAIAYGKREETSPESTTSKVDGRPAFLKYAGVRQISQMSDTADGIRHGTLLSCCHVLPKSERDFLALLRSEAAEVLLSPARFHDIPDLERPSQHTRQWLSAHNIMVIERQPMASHACLEMAILIGATPQDDINALAKQEGLRYARSSIGSAVLRFAGTRKIISCKTPEGDDCISPNPPIEGSEISFSMYSVSTIGELDLLLSGQGTDVNYEDESANDD